MLKDDYSNGYNWGYPDVPLSDFLGETFTKVAQVNNDEIIFTHQSGRIFKMYHNQDCYESVSVEDIDGDLSQLIGDPILQAEEVVSNENPEGVTKEWQDSFTWTFYKLGTVKGYATIRWYGESNGYYSESVSFYKTK